jgi:beta-galactosidase
MIKQRFNDSWFVGNRATSFNREVSRRTAVTLPHDAMIGRERKDGIISGGYKAYFTDGQYEYVKTFTVDSSYRNKLVYLEFEGVYADSHVFINGEYAGGRPYGYSNFSVFIGCFLKFDKENTVKVICETGDDHRWYSGAGIYRNVYLVVSELCHFALNGVYITTRDADKDYAVVEVGSVLESACHLRCNCLVLTEFITGDGKTVATDKTPVTLYGGKTTLNQRITIRNPPLWDTDSPNLLTCRSLLFEVSEGKEIPLDREENTFGVRVLNLDPERGLRINGKTVKLRGACIHHDNGIIGAATFERAEERRAELIKDAGFNAIRSSHNPLSRAMLNACDRLGLLVIDESFDTWTIGKTSQDYSRYFAEWWERDIEAMIEKDYNHPCVTLYSIGNEVPDTGHQSGADMGRKLAGKIRSLDRSRFIMNSINGMMSMTGNEEASALLAQNQVAASKATEGRDINTTMANMGPRLKQMFSSDLAASVTEESFAAVDVAGYNYMDLRYEGDRKKYPHRVICGSETFPPDIASNWELVERFSHVIGDFTWTGWDYLGEVRLGKIVYDAVEMGMLSGEYPWIAAWCGDIDITGFRRPISYYRQIVWGLRKEPYIAVLKPEHYGKTAMRSPWAWSDSVSSWTWPDFEDKPIQVEVYSDADEIALLLNGKEIGRSPAGKSHGFKAPFDTVYQPGKLEAVAYSGGAETGRFVLQTAEDVQSISVDTDKNELCLDCGDLAYLSIRLADKNGVVNNTVSRKITVFVEGSGVLQGLGSGDPATTENYTDNEHSTFEGRALAVIRPVQAGEIKVTVKAEGMPETLVIVTALPASG